VQRRDYAHQTLKPHNFERRGRISIVPFRLLYIDAVALQLLSTGQTTLCHSSILLLEPVTEALRALHVLVDASHNAALLARGEGLALEAVDAGVEALLDEVGVHLALLASHALCLSHQFRRQHDRRATNVHELLHLLLLHAVLELALLVLCKSVRVSLCCKYAC